MDKRLTKAAVSLLELVMALPAIDLGPLLDLTIGGLASLILAEQFKYLNRKIALPPVYYVGLSDRVGKMADVCVRNRRASLRHHNEFAETPNSQRLVSILRLDGKTIPFAPSSQRESISLDIPFYRTRLPDKLSTVRLSDKTRRCEG